MKVVSSKKVKHRKLFLAHSDQDGWLLKFKDDKHPYAYFFDNEQRAREAFDEIGFGLRENGIVVNLQSSRFASKKKCPRDHLMLDGKCRKSKPIKTHHYPGELSGTSTNGIPSVEVLNVSGREVSGKLGNRKMTKQQWVKKIASEEKFAGRSRKDFVTMNRDSINLFSATAVAGKLKFKNWSASKVVSVLLKNRLTTTEEVKNALKKLR